MQGIDGDLSDNKQNFMDDVGIDKLSDDMLITILSRLTLNEAARTSILSLRWKYLWRFAFRTLAFDDTRTVMKTNKFESWVNAVLKFYQPRLVESLIIRFSKIGPGESRPVRHSTRLAVDIWIFFAMHNEVESLDMDFSPLGWYDFPDIKQLLSRSHKVNSPFCALRSLRLVDIDVKDKVVHYFLASCHNLEELRIRRSAATQSLRIVDPPNLKVLEITKCFRIQSLEISAANLVSLAYDGRVNNSLLIKKIPHLCELFLGKALCDSFIFEPNKHSSYSDQLVKLVLNVHELRHGRSTIAPPDLLPQLCSLKRLELQVLTLIGRSLLFFTSLIKASPLLQEFRIEIRYMIDCNGLVKEMMPFPAVGAAEAVKFEHNILEVVEMGGYVGCSCQNKFLVHLFKIAPSLKRIVIDTQSDRYDNPQPISLTEMFDIGATSRIESKERAQCFVSSLPQDIEFVML